MDQDKIVKIAESILSQPTAPFHEGAVRAEIRRLLTGLPGVSMEMDDFGNLIATYRHGDVEPKFAFVAHMDHPGFVGTEFLGGLQERYRAKNPPTKTFGAISMLDLPPFDVVDGRIYSRACDDLIGCTAIVGAFADLALNKREGACVGLFTRAEEVGFVGSIYAAQNGTVSRDLTMISLEASDQNAGTARMGDGVIIRVGDKVTVFDSLTSLNMETVAKERKIPHQRSLMAGGRCEATAFLVYGYRTAALCVAIGNYHNQGPGDDVAAEYVSVDDTLHMALLCSALAQTVDFGNPIDDMRRSFEERVEQYRRYF